MTDPRDPTNYTLLTYFWVIGLAAWGGLTSYIRKYRAGYVRAFNIFELIGDVVISGLVGIITFWLCEAAGFPQLMTAALIGISSHMGSRALFLFERVAEDWGLRMLRWITGKQQEYDVDMRRTPGRRRDDR